MNDPLLGYLLFAFGLFVVLGLTVGLPEWLANRKRKGDKK